MATRKRDAHGRFLPKGKGGAKKGSGKKRKYKRNPGEEVIGLALANPSKKKIRHYAGRAYGAAKGFFGGLGLGDAVKFTGAAALGILAGHLARKKFGGVSSTSEKWQGRDYVVFGLGGLAASALARYGFKTKPATSTHIMMGTLAVIAEKILQDQIVPQSDTLKNWIGEEGEGAWNGAGFAFGAGGEQYQPGDLYLGDDGRTLVMGEDGQWRPIDESHRLPAAAGIGALVEPGRMGDADMYGIGALVEPSKLGDADMYGGDGGMY